MGQNASVTASWQASIQEVVILGKYSFVKMIDLGLLANRKLQELDSKEIMERQRNDFRGSPTSEARREFPSLRNRYF